MNKDKLLLVIDMQNDFVTGTLANEEAAKKLKEDAGNGYHAGTDAISKSLFLFSSTRKELAVYEE